MSKPGDAGVVPMGQRLAAMMGGIAGQARRIAAVAGLAEAVFADGADARLFLATPHPELGGQTPLQAAVAEGGEERVARILHSLTHGLPS